jgi:hypothetical protein
MSSLCQVASIELAVPAERAFAYLADGMKQGEWALGSWNRRQLDDGLFAGTSLFDGSELVVRLTGYPEHLLVEYEVGPSADDLRPLVWARVVPGPVLGLEEGTCVATLAAWRPAGEPDERWERLGVAFATEVHMIKGRLELGF